MFGTQHHEKLHVNNYIFDYFTLILMLHSLVKLKSRSLDVYNHEFILAADSENFLILGCVVLTQYGSVTDAQTPDRHLGYS